MIQSLNPKGLKQTSLTLGRQIISSTHETLRFAADIFIQHWRDIMARLK